jgi:hypothetical protein
VALAVSAVVCYCYLAMLLGLMLSNMLSGAMRFC